jgi:uncharacterized protein YndB with AHSA1/START domain
MPDIYHHFPIKAPIQDVFRAVSTPAGLDCWWTKSSGGEPGAGAEYQLSFGPRYDWRGIATRYTPNTEFELELTKADPDWKETRLGFLLEEKDGVVNVRFHHTGWPNANEHYRISCFCWAMYLRLLKRYVEFGEVVPYENRLEV